jgi:hypothetical protein
MPNGERQYFTKGDRALCARISHDDASARTRFSLESVERVEDRSSGWLAPPGRCETYGLPVMPGRRVLGVITSALPFVRSDCDGWQARIDNIVGGFHQVSLTTDKGREKGTVDKKRVLLNEERCKELVPGGLYFFMGYRESGVNLPEISTLIYLGEDTTEDEEGEAPHSLYVFQTADSYQDLGDWSDLP